MFIRLLFSVKLILNIAVKTPGHHSNEWDHKPLKNCTNVNIKKKIR